MGGVSYQTNIIRFNHYLLLIHVKHIRLKFVAFEKLYRMWHTISCCIWGLLIITTENTRLLCYPYNASNLLSFLNQWVAKKIDKKPLVWYSKQKKNHLFFHTKTINILNKQNAVTISKFVPQNVVMPRVDIDATLYA